MPCSGTCMSIIICYMQALGEKGLIGASYNFTIYIIILVDRAGKELLSVGSQLVVKLISKEVWSPSRKQICISACMYIWRHVHREKRCAVLDPERVLY